MFQTTTLRIYHPWLGANILKFWLLIKQLLYSQQVSSGQSVSIQSVIRDSSGQPEKIFSAVDGTQFSYNQNSDTLSWQLPNGYNPSSVETTWGGGSSEFSGRLIQPLTYKPEKASDITIKYVNSDNTEIHSPLKISGNVGESFDATTATYKLDIGSYTLDTSKLPSNSTGTLTEQPQTITYVYLKDKPIIVNVHDSNIYVGDTWKAQDNFDSALDKDGNAVDFSKVTIDDSKVDPTKAGTYDVTYTYEGVTSTAKVTVKDKLPISHNKTNTSNQNKPNSLHKTTNKNDKKSNLPKTGEIDTSLIATLGFGSLLAAILLLFRKNKPET